MMPIPTHPAVALIPMYLALWVASDYAYVPLYDGHKITVLVTGYCLELGFIAQYAASIIEEHVLCTSFPCHWSYGTIAPPHICSRTLDILCGVSTIQYVEPVAACPICAHAYAEIVAAVGNEVSYSILCPPAEELVI